MQTACALFYCHLWLFRLFRIFPHRLTNGTVFKIKFWTRNLCLVSVQDFAWNISDSKKNAARYNYKHNWFFLRSDRHSCQILMNLEFSPQIFENYSNTKFRKIPSSESWVVPYTRADRPKDTQTDITNSSFYYVFFRVVPRRLNYICRRFGTHYLFHLHWQVVCLWRWNR